MKLSIPVPAVLEPVPQDLARLVSTDGSWGKWRGPEAWQSRARAWFEAAGGDEWE